MKLKIKSFNFPLPTEILAFFIPKTNTIYYNKRLNKYSNLKKECLRHEKEHSNLLKGKMTCYKILQNLEFELRDSVHWRLSNPQNIIEKNEFYREQSKINKELYKITNKKLLFFIIIYMMIYQFWVMILIIILIPYEIYIERKYKK